MMRAFLHAVREIWWLLTGRHGGDHTPLMVELDQHITAARREAAASRRRQQRLVHIYEDDYLSRLRAEGGRRDRGH